MARKRKTLPKDFEEQLGTKSLDHLKAIFDTTELDARGGYSKGTALSFVEIPESLARWLVAQGLDVDLPDPTYGRTPLHEIASLGHDVSLLIELGADVNAPDIYGVTALHRAALRPEPRAQLIAAGADLNLRDQYGRTALEDALTTTANASLPQLAEAIPALITAGATVPDNAVELVTKLGERFEFYRERFNPDMLAEAEAALASLYAAFDVAPVEARVMHDGTSRIEIAGRDDADLFDKLWNFLVPGSGPALTVQGEVVRIAGKVNDELQRNGGGNWDRDFRAMLDALATHTAGGTPVAVPAVSRDDDDALELCFAAARWVDANRDPIPLAKPAYDR